MGNKPRSAARPFVVRRPNFGPCPVFGMQNWKQKNRWLVSFKKWLIPMHAMFFHVRFGTQTRRTEVSRVSEERGIFFPSVQLESFRFSTDTKETAIVLNETPNVAVKRDLISRVPMCQKVRLMWWQPLSFRFVQAWNKIDIYPNLRKLIPFVPGSSRDIKIYPQSSLTDDVVSGNISSSDSTRLCDMAGVIWITAPEAKAIYACKN